MRELPYLDAKTPDDSRAKLEKQWDRILEFRNVSAGYGGKTVLHNIHTDFYAWEVVSIVWESGCGKSTFVKIPGRLSEPDNDLHGVPKRDAVKWGYWQTGNVNFWPDPKASPSFDLWAWGFEELGWASMVRRNIITMPQGDVPLSHLTAEQNIRMPDATTRAVKEVQDETLRRLWEAIQNAKLDEVLFPTREVFEGFLKTGDTKGSRLRDRPWNFSGWQQQRISLATRFMMWGKRLIFDEWLSALDPKIQREIMGLMNDLVSKGIVDLVLVVSHSLNLVKASNRVIAMAHGTIVESGPTHKILKNPKTQAMKDVLWEWQETPRADHKIPHGYADEETAKKLLDEINGWITDTIGDVDEPGA